MRGPGGGNYYPAMGGMHYPPGPYGMMEEDQGYRSGGRGGRGGRGGGPRRNTRKGAGGRGSGGRSFYPGSGGGSGRQTPQSNSGTEGDGGESKTSASPTEEPPQPSGED